MKINNFRGDYTDISAKKEAPLQTSAPLQMAICRCVRCAVPLHGAEVTKPEHSIGECKRACVQTVPDDLFI